MGVNVADFENSGVAGIAITNFDDEMMALYYRPDRGGSYADAATKSSIGQESRKRAASWLTGISIATGMWICRLRRIGMGLAEVRAVAPDGAQMRMVKTGWSYLSQSELAVTFGREGRIEW